MSTPTIQSHSNGVTILTGVGRVRKRNEDSFSVSSDGRVLIVADGMGGHKRGDEASLAAVTAAMEVMCRPHASTGGALLEACEAADASVRSLSEGSARDPGSTIVIAAFKPGSVTIAHVGDSRAYRLRGGKLAALTADHAGHDGLSRCLGANSDNPLPTIRRRELRAGDRFLLCTDGLHGLVQDAEIEALWAHPDAEFAELAYGMAMNRGGHDNVTMVLKEAA